MAITSSISSWSTVQRQQAISSGKNPITGQALSSEEISALLANQATVSGSETDPSKLLAGKGQDVTNVGYIVEKNVSTKQAEVTKQVLTKEQEQGREAVAKGLGVEPELLQKYLDGDGSELTDSKYGIKRTTEQEKAFYSNLHEEIGTCPFKGTKPYLNPDSYTDKLNPTEKNNQPDCGIGAGDYLRTNSENPYIQNLTRAQATRLAMLLQPDVKDNQEKGQLDSTGCGDKNATTKYPWLAISLDPIMKKPVPTPNLFEKGHAQDLHLGADSYRTGAIVLIPGANRENTSSTIYTGFQNTELNSQFPINQLRAVDEMSAYPEYVSYGHTDNIIKAMGGNEQPTIAEIEAVVQKTNPDYKYSGMSDEDKKKWKIDLKKLAEFEKLQANTYDENGKPVHMLESDPGFNQRKKIYITDFFIQ